MLTQICFYLMSQSQHSWVIPPQSQPPVSRVTGDANLPAKGMTLNRLDLPCSCRAHRPSSRRAAITASTTSATSCSSSRPGSSQTTSAAPSSASSARPGSRVGIENESIPILSEQMLYSDENSGPETLCEAPKAFQFYRPLCSSTDYGERVYAISQLGNQWTLGKRSILWNMTSNSNSFRPLWNHGPASFFPVKYLRGSEGIEFKTRLDKPGWDF